VGVVARQDTHGRADILAALGPLPFGGAVERTRRRRAEPAPLVNGTVERSSLTVGE